MDFLRNTKIEDHIHGENKLGYIQFWMRPSLDIFGLWGDCIYEMKRTHHTYDTENPTTGITTLLIPKRGKGTFTSNAP